MMKKQIPFPIFCFEDGLSGHRIPFKFNGFEDDYLAILAQPIWDALPVIQKENTLAF
jgi:hypothetical protein